MKEDDSDPKHIKGDN